MGAEEDRAVLGLSGWRWAASGKHPSARDYFRVGGEFSLASGLAHWLDSGYRGAQPTTSALERCSWRFWAMGGSAGELACGVLQDSNDSLGRGYPLLLIGSGPLKGWEGRWELIPALCDKSWSHLEYVAARRFADLAALAAELAQAPAPAPDWESIAAGEAEPQPFSVTPSAALSELAGTVTAPDTAQDVLNVDITDGYDNLSQIIRIHSFAKRCFSRIPCAVFIGGTPSQSRVRFFLRPLRGDDFTYLWTFS